MNRTLDLSTVGNQLKKYTRSLIIDDILSEGGNISTEYYPGSFRAIGSKYKVSGVTMQFQTYGRPFVKRERKISLSMLQLGINRKSWQNQN